jgi:hypothetical protein
MQPSRLAPLFTLVLAAAAAGAAHGALPPGGRLAPELIAPVRDAVAYESGLQLAWTPPQRGGKHYVLVSRAPFDASAWTAPRETGSVALREVAAPVVALETLGVGIEGETSLYWAAAHLDPGAGRWSFSETRSVRVIPRFSNTIQAAPELVTSPVFPAAIEGRGQGPDRIRLAAGFEIDPAVGEPDLPGSLRAAAPAAGERRSMIVHFGAEDPAAVRERITLAGGVVVSYLPDHAFLVRLGPAARESHGDFAANVGASWTGPWQPAYKLSPRFSTESGAPQRATVLLFQDGDIAAVQARATVGGARIERASDNGINKILRIEAPAAAIEALAHEADVAWIEPYVQPTTDNDNAQWVVQTGVTATRRVWDMGIQGQGQIVMTSDSGINMNHNQFRDPSVPLPIFGDYPTHRKVIAYKNGSEDPSVAFGDHGSFHGTHTGGSAAGTDDGISTSPRDGMAKLAKLYFMDISGSALGTGVSPAADLNDLFGPPYAGNAAGAARISSNSWGSAVGGAYTVDSYASDQFMWNHPDFLIFYSNGNSGPSSTTVGSPASSKNTVGTGGTGNGANQTLIYNGSSRGPTADLRRKPTLCAPGEGVFSSTFGSGSYSNYTGTSMASPTAAGAATLIRQYLTEGWYPTGAKVPANGFEPSAALLKAMCINSSVNGVTGYLIPDNSIGWGRINADEVLYFAGDTRRLLLSDFTAGLGHQQAIEYQVNVTSSGTPLEVSLCWTDYPGNPSAAIQLVNNLDLTVTNGVVTYRGNVYAGGNSTTGGTYDSRNVEEAVQVAAPAAGVWTVRIEGTNVPLGPQPFGLAITGAIGSTAGTVAVDRAVYGSTSTVALRVIDTNAGPTVDVNVSSNSEPGGETVTLAGADGVFEGSVQLSPYEGSPGDGTVFVSHGDAVNATYLDASPAATLVADAVVSFNPPLITNVAASDQGSATVRVSWTTNVSASSTVEYGATPALGSSVADANAVLSHAVNIPGLAYGQSYYYDVVSVDLTGNLTRDDNGGAHYRFTAGVQGDLLLVYGEDTFDREARYTTALANLGWTYDTWRGAQADLPALGHLGSGLRSYKAIWWQPGLEQYPAFSDAARESLTAYLNGGGRLAVTGHDIAWGLADPSSPSYSAARAAWVQSTLHALFQTDPAGWTSITGTVGDPISGAYTGGVTYAEHRAGASGDNVDVVHGAGTGAYMWRSPTDDSGIRWESSGPLGSPSSATWGGQASRLAAMFFEWTSMRPTETTTSAIREDVMNKTLEYLVGRARPTVTVTAPNGGETLTGATTSVSWTESVAGGFGVGSRTIEYSPDGGQSWTLVSSSPGPSPYTWDLSAVPNTGAALVRVTITDDGTPALTRRDASNAALAIQRVGADLSGPTVVPGSVVPSPNPIDNEAPATLAATVTETHSGGALVDAAEWSFGTEPAAPGAGAAMTGSFPAATVDVSAALTTGTFNAGPGALWVRGRDTAGNWGAAQAVAVIVNGGAVAVGDPAPRALGLMAPAPNPVFGTTRIEYALPSEAKVDLAVFDVAGRKVRSLFAGTAPAGMHHVEWNRADGAGRRVEPGVYFVRMVTNGSTLQRRVVALK